LLADRNGRVVDRLGHGGRRASQVEDECRAVRPRLLAYVRRECGIRNVEDAEDLCQEVLLVYHRKLAAGVEVRSCWGLMRRIAHDLAVDARAKPALELVELGQAAELGVDPEYDVVVADREEAGDLFEVAMEVLTPEERNVAASAKLRVGRARIAKRLGVSERKVKRVAERGSAKLRSAIGTLGERGLCAMRALAIEDCAEGRIGPDNPRWALAQRHLARCSRCRGRFTRLMHKPSSAGSPPDPR